MLCRTLLLKLLPDLVSKLLPELPRKLPNELSQELPPKLWPKLSAVTEIRLKIYGYLLLDLSSASLAVRHCSDTGERHFLGMEQYLELDDDDMDFGGRACDMAQYFDSESEDDMTDFGDLNHTAYPWGTCATTCLMKCTMALVLPALEMTCSTP